jgi:hypothetical protein
MLFKRNIFATLNLGHSFFHQGLCPGKIVNFLELALANSLLDELLYRFLNRREFAPFDADVDPVLLLRCERDCHGSGISTERSRHPDLSPPGRCV